MNAEQTKLFELLKKIRNEEYIRNRIYLNKGYVDTIFFQRVNASDKITLHRAFSGELGGGFNALIYELKAKFSHTLTTDVQITIPTLIKAHILEYYLRDQGHLKDPSRGEIDRTIGRGDPCHNPIFSGKK